jgi:agmatinase
MPGRDGRVLDGLPVHWDTFLDTPPAEADRSTARIVVIPVPYDGTTSYRSGARDGPAAIISASRHLEDYDLELDRDISLAGIHTTPAVEPAASGPEATIARVRDAVSRFASTGKLVALLGGEHTITLGAVQALLDVHPDLSVLYLDAHADLRDEYMGTRWGHASVARRVHELCPLVEVGVRSVSAEERDYIRDARVPVCFRLSSTGEPFDPSEEVLKSLSPTVYVSVDLDVFDPSAVAAVGTPEPGGLTWDEVTRLLRTVGERRNIVGFDITELSPGEGPEAGAFTAAKLAYKLMGYATSP